MRTILDAKNLSKHFKILNSRQGLIGSFKDLFSRNYRIIKAVDNISMEIKQGEVVGFIGPNGAGKSTTIKMLIGVLEPTAGDINVNGFVPFKNRVKYTKNIGVVIGQRTQLWWDLPVIESFKLLKEVYSIKKEVYEENLAYLNDLVHVADLFPIPVRKLSLGQRMLCDIVASFLHNPDIIFFDEPSIGLDISIKSKVRMVIKNLNQVKKTTIIITSHDVGDIEELCGRIILIDKGSILFDGDIGRFNKLAGSYRTLKIELYDEKMHREVLEAIEERFRNDGSVSAAKNETGWLHVAIDQDRVQLLTVLDFILKKFQVKDIKVEEIELEHVIKKMYDGALR
jgi:ABC-type uncharacterized transport system ATPase subunit